MSRFYLKSDVLYYNSPFAFAIICLHYKYYRFFMINHAIISFFQSVLRILCPLTCLALLVTLANAADDKMQDGSGEKKVSYYKDIRPIFQARCHGCHQPAKNKGDYDMTTYEHLLDGGEEGDAIIPRKPDTSFLMKQIAIIEGEAEMPRKRDPLKPEQIELIRLWIAQGAIYDTPENAKQRYGPEHLPVYTKPPIITSIDYSPDGELLAVAGFHEVLLHKADGSELVARLVGLSERIESVRFSPDGKLLAVTGGLPARMGEVFSEQIERS